MKPEYLSDPHWSISSIPYDQIDVASMRPRDDMFYLLTAASFIEIASDTYTRNLIEYFEGDAETAGWLAREWEHEEMQHGRALRAYVEHVWPEFNWEQAYAAFFAEYSKVCTVEEFEATRGLEMAARCVVEMGTATYYRSIHDHTDEPVLRMLVNHIKTDEVSHYKHFYQYFIKYNAIERHGRFKVFGALLRRLIEMRDGDAECGLWHAFVARHPDAKRDGPEFRAMFANISAVIRRNYPAMMAIKMLLKPLMLPARVQQAVHRPLAHLTTRWILR